MFKKIEIWILYLAIILAVIFALFFGILVRQELVGKTKLGIISKSALFFAEIPKNLKIIYLKYNEPGLDLSIKEKKHLKKPRFKRFIDSNREELLLLSRYDGDISRSVVEIIDLNSFKVLHTYKPDVYEINNKTDTSKEEFRNLLVTSTSPERYIINHPAISSDGSIVFHSRSPLVKVDFCSRLVWINDTSRFHHSNTIDSEGNYWAPSEIFPYSIDKNLVGAKYGNFHDDAITKVSQDGKILYQKSVTDILLENNYKYLIFAQSNYFSDPIHLNDIEVVSKDSNYWKKDDLFLSIRNLAMIMHYRPSTNKIINIIKGPFYSQHDVDIISDNKISIFNNNAIHTSSGTKILEGTNNEILIYNFETKKFSNKFKKSMRLNEVATVGQGISDILKDGSMMVEETNSGRILFFNSKGDLEWEYFNKAKNNKNYLVSWSRIIEDKNLILKIREKIKKTKCLN